MGFFSNTTASSAAGLAPLTIDRVKAALDRAGWNYDVDPDGDLGGGWEYGVFYFFLNGQNEEFLCVRGYWHGKLEEGDYLAALEACNAWNTEAIWPKTYLVRDDEGMVRVHAEHNVDYEFGLTDDQLDQHLLCAINTGMAFFEKINETFPEAWARFKPGD